MNCNADGQDQVPQLALTLGQRNITEEGKFAFTQLCKLKLDISEAPTVRKDTSGMSRVTALFQNNFRRCVPLFDQVTSFRLQSLTPTKVSFCLDNITLLPSTLQPAGKLATLV